MPPGSIALRVSSSASQQDQPRRLQKSTTASWGCHGGIILRNYAVGKLRLTGGLTKCSFCAGRGFRGSHILHQLRQCKGGGAAQVRKELGEAMYEEGILPSNGCDSCHLPYDFCNGWMRNEGGEWVTHDISGRHCQYGRYLLSDTMIGLYYCGRSELKQEIQDGAEEYCEIITCSVLRGIGRPKKPFHDQ